MFSELWDWKPCSVLCCWENYGSNGRYLYSWCSKTAKAIICDLASVKTRQWLLMANNTAAKLYVNPDTWSQFSGVSRLSRCKMSMSSVSLDLMVGSCSQALSSKSFLRIQPRMHICVASRTSPSSIWIEPVSLDPRPRHDPSLWFKWSFWVWQVTMMSVGVL